MFKPLSLYLGSRYVISRQGHGFSSFISASSTVGIALGVLVLIVVLSAMNGFENALAQRLLSIVPHAEMVAVNEPIGQWQKRKTILVEDENILAAAPVITMTGMMQYGKQLKGVEVRGVDETAELTVSAINDFIVEGRWADLFNKQADIENPSHGVILGAGIAKKLQVSIGDNVQLLLPHTSMVKNNAQQDKSFNQKFPAPQRFNMKVVAIFKFGGVVDDTLAYINHQQAADIMGYNQDETQGMRLKVTNVFDAPRVVRKVANEFNHYVYMLDWTRTQGHLFNDIQLVRMVMFIVMVLVIAVASFNIVSTLIMVVNEKRSDIAILKTMGASSSVIMLTFVFQGMVNGVLGCASGAILGVLIANNLTELFQFIEQLFGVQFLTADVYFIDYLPSKLHASDVYMTVATALLMSILATLYPAWRATKVDPAQVLGQV